jgi:hypothetical protein
MRSRVRGMSRPRVPRARATALLIEGGVGRNVHSPIPYVGSFDRIVRVLRSTGDATLNWDKDLVVETIRPIECAFTTANEMVCSSVSVESLMTPNSTFRSEQAPEPLG